MKASKKILVILMAVLMIFSGCAKAPETSPSLEATLTPTLEAKETASPTATATEEAEGTEEPIVTAEPIPTEELLGPDNAGEIILGGTDEEGTYVPLPSTPSSPTINETVGVSLETSEFEGISTAEQAGWTKIGNAKLYIKPNGYSGQCLYFTKTQAYESAAIDISKYIKSAGNYEISFKYKLEGADSKQNGFSGVIRTDSETSFSTVQSNKNTYYPLKASGSVSANEWHTYETALRVNSSDIGKGGKWLLGMHMIQDKITGIYIDSFTITRRVYKDEVKHVTSTETWVANEIVLVSSEWYDKPFYDVDVNLVLTNGSVSYTIPGFWDGGTTWRVRFMCPTAGTWTYTTKCTNTGDSGLHNQSSTVNVKKYSGNLEIYKRGWVKVQNGTKYFMYNDGTPFFYLGDTHWNLSSEPLSNIQTIVQKRLQQRYTVIQSEPLGASFKFENGIDEADIPGLRENDEKFKYIANNGMLHVNASFFYPSTMTNFIDAHGGFSSQVIGSANHSTGAYPMYDISGKTKTELERICRYWVARYSAFPVMWSLGQEVDNDFFWNRDNFNNHEKWSYVNNPYRYVAEYIRKHDPYNSPLTAHMEGTGNSASITASNSAFRDVAAHDFYAAQWSPDLTGKSIKAAPQDFWNNGQGKPAVNYEGRYCYLWTKNFGARAQGWMAYLSGMFGYGWGGQDTWSYLNTYSEDTNSSDGVDTVTSAEKKAATWQDSLEYSSAYQMGYMRTFFEDTVGQWYDLIPRFDDTAYLTRASKAHAVIASNSSNTKIVVYFYNFSNTSVGAKPNSTNGTATGTLGKLSANSTYQYLWFDPINNTTSSRGTITANAQGKATIPQKPTNTDMVLYVYK